MLTYPKIEEYYLPQPLITKCFVKGPITKEFDKVQRVDDIKPE